MSADVVVSALRPDDLALLSRLAALAPSGRVALVGGAVRDALLGLLPLDLDVVVEGGGVRAIAESAGLPFTYHDRYDNATLTLPDGRALDLVRSRGESYERPGAAPTVAPGDLSDDLARRDFSVNAMAVVIGSVEFLDPHDGQQDLARRLLRPLHEASFREDPSRLARAARLGARLGFDLSPEGRGQVSDALAHAPQTPRLTSEFQLTLAEERPGRVLALLRSWEAPHLFEVDATEPFEALDALRGGGQQVSPLTYAAVWLGLQPDPASAAEARGLGERPLRLLERARSDRAFPADSPEAHVRHSLGQTPPRPRLTGADLLALGVPPGPGMGRALAHLAELRRIGAVQNVEEERAALHDYLRRVSQ